MIGACRWISSVSGCVVLAGLLLSPVRASCQRDSQQKNLSLSAAIEQVRRSPFHARDRVNRSLDGARDQGIDPASLFFRHGGGHPVTPQEAGEDTQTATDRESNRSLFLWTTLGIAAGDFIAISILNEVGSLWILAASVPVTTLGLTRAGVDPGLAFAASSLGLAAGMGAGLLTLVALEEPLYMAAFIPGVLAYYGVRLAVTRLIAKRGVS